MDPVLFDNTNPTKLYIVQCCLNLCMQCHLVTTSTGTVDSPHAYRQKHTESEVFELLSKGAEPKTAQNIIHALALVCFAYVSDLLCCCSYVYLHAIQVCVSHLHRLATADILQ